MSPRVLKAASAHAFQVRPARWDRASSSASSAASSPSPYDETAGRDHRAHAESLAASLDHALDQCRLAHERIIELERTLAAESEIAFERGLEAGREESRAAAQHEIDACSDTLAATVAGLTRLRAEWLRQSEAGLLQLALAIARRVLRRELSAPQASAAESFVAAALDRLQSGSGSGSGSGPIRIVTSPAHEPAIRARLASAGAGSGSGPSTPPSPGIEIVADPALPPGSLRLETSQGLIDASLDAQLDEIERGLSQQQQLEP
jgi:flagellar assembly protein FliH